MSDQELPAGWVETDFEVVIDQIVGGGTPSKANEDYFSGSIPFMTVKDLQSRFPVDTIDHISETAVKNSATTIIPADTIIIATRMALGKIARPQIATAINQDLKALFLNKYVGKNFVEFWWNSQCSYIESLGTGTTVKGIRLEDIRSLRFPLPPLAEQQRIAHKLDTLLAQLDTCKAHLNTIPATLKRFRQSVLAAATTGRLTQDWREANGVTEEWDTMVKLDQCFSIFSGYAFKKDEYTAQGSRLLQIANVGYGKVLWEVENFIPLISSTTEYSNFSLRANDIVLALNRPITNDLLKVAMITPPDLPATIYQRVACLRLSIEGSSKYVFLCMQSESFLQQVRSNLQGSDQPYINTSSLDSLEIPLPSLPEQQEIVRRVEKLFALADQIEARYQTACAQVERLQPAILAKAFRGELVPQDPADEPASRLLERIKAQRAAQAPAPKRGRKAAATLAAKSPAQAAEPADENAAPAPRKRGRPRKVI